MKRIFIPAVVFLVFITGVAWAGDYARDQASWWADKYGLVSSKDDPQVGRAEKVFSRLYAAADKRGDRLPRLVVLRVEGDPYAAAIKDGSVLLTYGGLKICYKDVSPEKGDARLAFVLGHELAHLAKDDFWHEKAFSAVETFMGDPDARKKAEALLEGSGDIKGDKASRDRTKMKELQADAFGLVYSTMAGYDPKAVVSDDGSNFFEYWVTQITGNKEYGDETHPTPKDRAEFLKAQMAPVVEKLDYFTFGVKLYQTGGYTDAILLFERFKEDFPGREVFNNLGLSHYQLAMKTLTECDADAAARFKLSTELDTETQAEKFSIRRGERKDCFKEEEFTEHIAQAVTYLALAVEKDKGYMPARINLSAAMIMAGEYTKAMAVADEALKLSPDNSQAGNNKAVALYLYGKTSGIPLEDTAVKTLGEVSAKEALFPDAVYNRAAIETELGRKASAGESWARFVELEKRGLFHRAAMKQLGREVVGTTSRRKETASKSPVPLGEIKSGTKTLLKGMKETKVKLGNFEASFYTGTGLKIFVIDYVVELVTAEETRPLSSEQALKEYGEPERRIKTSIGTTLVYDNFVVETTDGVVKAITYFATGAVL